MLREPASAPIFSLERRSASLAVLVAEKLREMILDARFDLGEALSEDRLAASMGVSRTPVREALNMLQLQGLITIVPQRGSFVFVPSEEDTRELCEFRTIVESRALALALLRKPADTLAEMRAAIADLRAGLQRNDPLACAQSDSRFHNALVSRAGNTYLFEAYGLASGRIATLRAHLAGPRLIARQAEVLQEHESITDAFASADLIRAEVLLSAHILRMRENFSRAIREGDIVIAPATGRRVERPAAAEA